VTAVDDREIATVEYNAGDGWEIYSEPVTVSMDGETPFAYRAVDTAGNSSGEKTLLVRIDTTAPAVSLLGGPSGEVEAGKVPPAPTCEASDSVSGLRSCEVSGYSVEVGVHTVTATATDNAGNVGVATLE